MKNEITFTLSASNVSPGTFTNFETLVRACHENLIGIATEAGMPEKIDVILAEDFDRVVSENQRDPATTKNRFSSTRQNGCVAGKNLAQDDPWNHVVIVFNSFIWNDTIALDYERVFLQFSIIAHELAHPYIARMRHKSGSTELSTTDSFQRNARNLARLMVDEYFADCISDVIIETTSQRINLNGKTSIHVWDFQGENHLNNLKTHLTDACPEIPTHVAEYKSGKISFEVMWERSMSAIFHLFTLYIHARAFADATGRQILIFDSPEIKQLPFAQKYIPKTLPDFLQRLRHYSPKMTLTEWREMESNLFPLGEKCLYEIWGLLGAPEIPKPAEASPFLKFLSFLLKQEGNNK